MKLRAEKLTPTSPNYPQQLLNIPGPPKQLFWLGEAPEKILSNPCVAVVGSRKVSAYGHSVTTKIVGDLARQGIVIVSGLALGVDSIAHAAALKAGGLTIAVLPCGLDRIYPSSHHQLARDILKSGGVLVTEYNEGQEIFSGNFIARNRIIAGLGLGVLITEAAEKSGSLHTANFALEQGSEVFAVPGNITSQTSVGTNNLIKSGAVVVTDAQDIFNALKLDPKLLEKREVYGDNEEETIILKLIADGTHDSAELQKISEIDLALFNQTLTMLEITSKIKSEGAGRWTLS